MKPYVNIIAIVGLLLSAVYLTVHKIKYITFYDDGSRVCHGWRHQRHDISCMLAIAEEKKKTLLLQDTICAPKIHSKTAFSQYNDKSICVKTTSVINTRSKFMQYHLKITSPIGRFILRKYTMSVSHTAHIDNWTYFYDLCKNPLLSERKKQIYKMIQPPKSVRHSATVIVDMIKPFAGIHVRRGDKSNNKTIDIATRAASILEKIVDKIEFGTNIYIATNEFRRGFFNSLKARYHVFTVVDFENVVDDIRYNPFALLVLEECILERAFFKVSTFKEHGYNISLI